ncbi:unnamed protein product [Ascophyllum nodosum]
MSEPSEITPTTAVEDERDRMSARIFELENRLRETEEELEYYFDFYKKAKRGGGATGGSSTSTTARRVSAPEDEGVDESTSSTSSDHEDDGSTPGKDSFVEPWSKTLGRNATVEYIRDSPMFRKRLWAFQETLKPLKGHTTRVLNRVGEYCKAAEEFKQRGVALAEELSSKEASRLMFSKNHTSATGDLAANVAAFSASFQQVHQLVTLFVDSVRSGLAAPLLASTKGFRDHDELADELDFRGREYELRLSRALDQKELPKQGPLHDRVARARWDFELYRFDLVRYVNQLDSKKVLLLETGINNIFYALLAFFQGGLEILRKKEKDMRKRQMLLDGMNRRYDSDRALWAYVRSRLEAELQGALPPPGAPPGARAPFNPRACCPVYVAEITTEILSADSQEASSADLAHCKDEGMLKQGYLFKRQVLGKERCWYRLHASKLYTLQLRKAAMGDLPTCVFDLTKGVTVAKRPGKVPFCFLLVGDDGYRLELQAESEDDMLRWMAAIRRCHRFFSEGGGGDRDGDGGGDDSTESVASDSHSQREGRRGRGRATIGLRADALMKHFRRKNAECAECGSPSIEWASVNLGVTLCGACATVHGTLGSSISNVRSLELDRWSVFVLKSLVEDMGNDAARQIWECNISSGWTKPTRDSGTQGREQWIIAKYRWYGFVGEDRRHPATISKALHHAAARGDVQRIAWCIAHKGNVNWPDPDAKGRSPLHVACEADQRRAVVVLLLNGANMYAQDDQGVTPQDMVGQDDPHSDIARLLVEKETGDLW